MKITLSPELEKLIQQQMMTGQYDSAERVIAEALSLLNKRNEYEDWIAETRQKIDIAAEQLERGEGVDGETAIAQIRAKLRQQADLS